MVFYKEFSLIDQIESTLIDPIYKKEDFVELDLSVNNQDLKDVDISSSTELKKYIDSYVQNKRAKVAYGGYLEKRNIYQRSNHFKGKFQNVNERNIHLGVDIWQKEGTNVIAPLDGEIHSFNNNQNYGDYGPTIILKHTLGENSFFTLYGHLSLNSISDIKIGQKIKRGEVLAKFGNSEENGDYPPHLHFQIILDIENYFGDYPGVTCFEKLKFYTCNCPDPNILMKL